MSEKAGKSMEGASETGSGRDDESDGDKGVSAAYATPVLTSKSKKVYVVVVGH